MSALMNGRAVRRLLIVLCCFFINSLMYPMEEREGNEAKKEEQLPIQKPRQQSDRRKSLDSKKPESIQGSTTPQPVRKKKKRSRRTQTLPIPIPISIPFIRPNEHEKEKRLTLAIPMPKYPAKFANFKKAQKALKHLVAWGINYRFEDGISYADNVFNFDIKLINNDNGINRFECIEFLLSQDGLDLTTQDQNGVSPLGYFIRSISSADRTDTEKTYIPRIFHLLLDHGYNSQFKKELSLTYKNNDPRIEVTTQQLCLFPLYTTLDLAKAFVREKLSNMEEGINTTDTFGMTMFDYIIFSLNDPLILYNHNPGHLARLFKYLCTYPSPKILRSTNYFFSALLHFKPNPDSPTSSASEQHLPHHPHFEISGSQPVPTKKKESIKPISDIFREFMQIAPKHTRATFMKHPLSERYIIGPLLSPFPLFIQIPSLKTKLEDSPARILDVIDEDDNNYVHHLADPTDHSCLFDDTLENRLAAMELILAYEQGKALASKANKNGKFPIEILIESFSLDVLRNPRALKVITLLDQETPYKKFITSLDVVDEEGNTRLHNTAHLSKKQVSIPNTIEKHLFLIKLILSQKKGKELAAQKNNNGQFPSDILRTSLQTNISESHRTTLQEMIVVLDELKEIAEEFTSPITLDMVDEQDNNFLHYLAMPSSLENRLLLIKLILSQEKGRKLASKTNKDGQLPLEIALQSFTEDDNPLLLKEIITLLGNHTPSILESGQPFMSLSLERRLSSIQLILPEDISNDHPDKELFQKIIFALIIPITTQDRATIINNLTKGHLLSLSRIIRGLESPFSQELLKLTAFRLTALQ